MRHALAYYTFLARLYMYDDNTFSLVRRVLRSTIFVDLQGLHLEFYKHFDDGFASRDNEKVTINAHTFMHLGESRIRTGPLWQTNTERFEGTYAVLRKCYCPGTPNCGKQILQNFYMKE
jgi:hypothetical protein